MLLVCKKLAGVESNICEYAGKVESHPGRYIITQFSVERQLFQPCRLCSFLCYIGSILGAMTGIRFVDIAPWPKSVLLYVPFMASVRKSK